MTDVPGTSPERPIIWSPGRPATGSRRRPVDVPIQNFCIFVFPVKNSNRCVKQELLHLKKPAFVKLSIFCWSPKSPLEVPWRSPGGPLEVLDVRTFRGPSGDVPGTSRAGWVIAYLLTQKIILMLFRNLPVTYLWVVRQQVRRIRSPAFY